MTQKCLLPLRACRKLVVLKTSLSGAARLLGKICVTTVTVRHAKKFPKVLKALTPWAVTQTMTQTVTQGPAANPRRNNGNDAVTLVTQKIPTNLARPASAAQRRSRDMTAPQLRPIYTVRLRPQPGIDPIRALRAALKVLLRRFGLRAIEVREDR